MFNSCETEKKTNNLLYIVIVFLLIIIAILAFFIGKNSTGDKISNGGENKTGTSATNTNAGKDITVTIIDDKRCENCGTSDIVSQLKQLPFFKASTFVEKDFSDSGMEDYVKNNEIKYLPAVILSTNKIDDNGEIQQYLKELKDKQYSLEIGSHYDPLAKRSANGFLLLDKETLKKIKENTYLKGNKDAKVSWIEYSDLECPFCAKLHNSDVPSSIESTYGDKVNKYFNSFPLEFHQNAMDGARIVECLGEQKGSDAYYSLIEKAYKDEKSAKDYLIAEAIKLGANKETLEKCVTDGKFDTKIKQQLKDGSEIFGITGTPGSILINNETGEYELISGAYPFESFKVAIDKLLK
ncbi:MAG: thioredoxin domain-containing protein [Candidatus Gracilibacteria bacterium]|nr:thioredoxin domain-containing protein [Candidatus Gracilibacteria bacterium]